MLNLHLGTFHLHKKGKYKPTVTASDEDVHRVDIENIKKGASHRHKGLLVSPLVFSIKG